MSNPVAAHTFDFVRWYLSTRTGGAPGSGTWSVATTLFDGSISTDFNEAITFSAGALDSTEPLGIVCATDASPTPGLAYIGNGLPTAPILISFPGQAGGSAPFSAWETAQGAFTFGGAKYLPVYTSGAGGGILYVLKSSDEGATWANIDAASGNAPAGADGTFGAMQRVDGKLYFFIPSSEADTDFAVFVFNMATDLWEPSFAPLTEDISDFNLVGDSYTNGLWIFPNGDVGVFYNNGSGNPVYRLWVSSGAGWGSEIPASGAGFAMLIIGPDPELLHLLTYNSASNAEKNQVNYQTVTHAGVVTPVSTIPATVGGSDGVNHACIQNGLIFVPRDDKADNDNSVWVADLTVGTFFKEFLPIPPGETGVIETASPNGTGTGYVVGDTGTIDGGEPGLLATYQVSSVRTNAISTYSWSTPNLGTGYVVGDLGLVDGGTIQALYQILAVGVGGAVTEVVLTTLGAGYSTGLTTTTSTTGVGTGLEISVDSVFDGVSVISITDRGGGYSVVNNVGTTNGGAQPGVGTGLTINITSVQGKEPSCAYMMFPNGYSLTPPTPPQPALACPINNTGQLGQPFSAQLQASGGTPPYTFSVVP